LRVRTVYMGTTGFAVMVLERLASSPHRPTLVVTRPDRPRGRGRRLQSTPVAQAACTLGIELDQPDEVNGAQARERMAAARPEAVCICAYGALIREPLLSGHRMLNVHPSLLPRWRGAAPIERAIAAGDSETGVSIMRPVAELDAGPLLLQRAEPIRADDDYGALASRLAALAGELLVEVLDTEPEERPQPCEGLTYAAKVERAERRLDPARTPAELERAVRALTPHIGAYVEPEGGERLGVRRAAPAAAAAPAPSAGRLEAREGRLLLGAAGGALELLEVQPSGGRPMEAGAYLRGRVSAERQGAAGG